ncbi:MAG: hypothetical protein K2P88_11835 [Chitinophagaceae bacterium]|nr:hypothetical protein [Chitinophagaceae bacterium]
MILKKITLLVFSIWIVLASCAQESKYDIIHFTAPTNWKKEEKTGVLEFSYIDKKTKSWMQVGIYKASKSAGTVEQDLANDWQELVQSRLQQVSDPTKSDPVIAESWTIQSATGNFLFNNKSCQVLVTTSSGYGVKICVVITMSDSKYMDNALAFLSTLSFDIPDNSKINPTPAAPSAPEPEDQKTKTDEYQFNTTQFDDGWISTVQNDWVLTKKGDLKVYIHYPNQKIDAYNSSLYNSDLNAWKTLIEPRYSTIQNFQWRTIQSFESICYMQAIATEKSTGNKVFIVLFKKLKYDGHSRYLEFVAPDQAAYEAAFGAYHNDEFNWERHSDMQYRNKFSISPKDLLGNWSASDYASLTYYYVNTGSVAGATATSLSDQFTFLPSNRYESDHSGASGVVGNQKFYRETFKGQSIVENWAISLTNRADGATESYKAYFEAVKGGRILVMQKGSGYTITLVKSKKQ